MILSSLDVLVGPDSEKLKTLNVIFSTAGSALTALCAGIFFCQGKRIILRLWS